MSVTGDGVAPNQRGEGAVASPLTVGDPVLSPPVNLRDLGGTAVEGGTVLPGVLWRADDLSCVTEDWANQAVRDGLSHIIDLRSADEVRINGRGHLGRMPVSYHHTPLIDPAGGPGSADAGAVAQLADLTPDGVGQTYLGLMTGAAPTVVALLGMMAAASGTTVLHCAAGKDRTGVLAASVLTVLGAEDEVIIADYAATAVNLHAIYTRMMTAYALPIDAADAVKARGMMERLLAAPVTSLPAMFGANPESMRAMLTLARQKHGGLVGLLRGAGLTDDLTAALRRRMVAVG